MTGRGPTVAAAFLAFAAYPAAGQLSVDDPRPTITELPAQTGCFEIFLSPRQARETYLLNACTGETWLRVDGIDRGGWQLIPREPNDQDTETLSQIKHYQLVSSGLTARDTFLLNTLNGASWQLYEGADGALFWGAMVRAE